MCEVLRGSFSVDSFDRTDREGLVVDGGDVAGVQTMEVRFMGAA
jgi:hypothetical protein